MARRSNRSGWGRKEFAVAIARLTDETWPQVLARSDETIDGMSDELDRLEREAAEAYKQTPEYKVKATRAAKRRARQLNKDWVWMMNLLRDQGVL